MLLQPFSTKLFRHFFNVSYSSLALTYFSIKNKPSYSLVKKKKHIFKQHLRETYQLLNLESFAKTKLQNWKNKRHLKYFLEVACDMYTCKFSKILLRQVKNSGVEQSKWAHRAWEMKRIEGHSSKKCYWYATSILWAVKNSHFSFHELQILEWHILSNYVVRWKK